MTLHFGGGGFPSRSVSTEPSNPFVIHCAFLRWACYAVARARRGRPGLETRHRCVQTSPSVIASSAFVLASTAEPFTSRRCIFALKRGQCWPDKMSQPWINCLAQRIEGKIGRLFRRCGHKRSCRPQQKFEFSHAEPHRIFTHTRHRGDYGGRAVVKLSLLLCPERFGSPVLPMVRNRHSPHPTRQPLIQTFPNLRSANAPGAALRARQQGR